MSQRRPKVFITRHIAPAAIEALHRVADIDVWSEPMPPPRHVVLERSRGCDGLITLLTERVDVELLDAAPTVRVVSNMAVGVDNVDLAECSRRGIPVGHTPHVLTEAVADFTFALLLAAARHLVPADAYARSGAWRTWNVDLLLGRPVAHATLGIIGFGAIGQAVARRAHGFGMRVLHHSRSSPGSTDKATLLREADFVSLHLPLTAQTRHFIGAAELAAMKPNSVLINTARGGIVDQPALVAALRRGQPAFAALDVTDPEPPSHDDPLLTLPNVLLAPHLGSATFDTRERMALLAVENLVAGLAGRPLPHQANR